MNLLNARSHQAAREPNLLFASMKKKEASPESWCRSILQTEMKTVYQRCVFFCFFFKSLALSGPTLMILSYTVSFCHSFKGEHSGTE